MNIKRTTFKMSASIKQLSNIINRKIFSSLKVDTVRGFSVTSTTQKPKSQRSRNLGGKKNTRGKSYGIKKNDGCFVHKGEIVVNQCGLRFYPGENVEADRTNRLVALADGTVMVTCEKLDPYPESPLYGPVQNGLTIHKKFFHIIPVPLKAKFKLVSET